MRAQAEPSPSTAAAPATRSTSRRTGLIGTSWDTVLSVGARGEARTGGHVLYSPTGHILGSRTGQVLGRSEERRVGKECRSRGGRWRCRERETVKEVGRGKGREDSEEECGDG